jgi:predicted RNA-binding protein with TRAM domain
MTPGGAVAIGSGSPIAISGLTVGTTYTVTVRAANPAGHGPASAQSNAIALIDPPGAPTGVNAVEGDEQATVTFTASVTDGGGPVHYYTATATPGGRVGTSTGGPITVTGLTNGIAYTFTVTATNDAGTGAASAPSPFVVPASQPRPHARPPDPAPRPSIPDFAPPSGPRPAPPAH